MNAQLFAKLSGIYHVPRVVTDHCNGMFFLSLPESHLAAMITTETEGTMSAIQVSKRINSSI